MTPDALGGNRILIVDDDERISQMLQIALEKVGYTCDTASNAGLAGDRLREKEYELVFSTSICRVSPGWSIFPRLNSTTRIRL